MRSDFPPEKIELVKNLRKMGISFAEIGERLGVCREVVRSQLRWATMTPEQKDRRREMTRINRAKLNPEPLKTVRTLRVPAEALMDRAMRQKAERSITAEFFGDPAPGWSALDKRGV